MRGDSSFCEDRRTMLHRCLKQACAISVSSFPNREPPLADGLVGGQGDNVAMQGSTFFGRSGYSYWTATRSVSIAVFDVSGSDAQRVLQMSSDQLFSRQ